MSLLLLVGQTVPLLGNPTGGAVVAGGATIGAAGATLTVNQSTQNAIINWQTFSIASGETTKFIVPNSGAETLNRVAAGNPSQIYGNLQSNGILYLVNPSGIVVGPNGRIDTAGFMASTLDVSNEQFLAGGNLEFAGTSDAAINNAGTIHASTGDVYLIANQVNNTGKISAPKGNVGLAAGSDVLFQQAGSQHLFVQATPAGTTRATGVTNAGTIRAATAELKAAGGNAYALAINNTGVIAATGYKKINGQVYLTSDGGSITNSGKISAKQKNGNGGTIALTGTSSTATSSANTVTNSGTLDASATKAGGTGGSISVKNMTGATVHSGAIIAKGGQGGTGGTAEVSGYTVSFTGTVDLTAAGGTTGYLLLDPANLDVISTTGGGTIIGGQNDPTSSTISNTTVDDALQMANVTLNADNSITIDGFIQWLSGSTLTLSTNNVGSTITFNNSIGAFNFGGNLVIDTKGATDAVTGAGGFEISGTFDMESGAFFQGAADTINNTLPTFSAGNFVIGPNASFLHVTGGNGTASTPYQVADIYGLQGLASATYSGADIKLVSDIDATGTPGWNSGEGFLPLGSTANYTGTFDGAGFTISGLTINQPTGSNIGLFSQTGTGATIENLVLSNVVINGQNEVGALVGQNNGGTISEISVSGSVTGSAVVNTGEQIGGLVGSNNSGTIHNISLTSSVSGADDVGGLAGFNGGSITSAVNTGSVTASGSTDGGLVGWDNDGASVTSSSNTGAVSGGGVNVGGLIGYNRGTVSTSFNSGSVYSGNGSAGGLVGENDFNVDIGAIINCGSIGSVTAVGSNAAGGLVGLNFGTITDSYSTGSVGGSSNTGGLVSENPGTVTGSFWDTVTSGQATSAGGTGLATAALLMESTYTGAGWNIGTNLSTDAWVIFDGQTRPILASAYSTTITDAHQLQLIGLNATTLAANYTVANNINLSGTFNPADVWGTSTTNGGAGFVPIGGGSSPYTGTFNGQGFTINGLYINRTTDETGLFGYASGELENVALTNVNVTGASVVGGLAGTIGNPSSGFQGTGVLSQVSSSGTVTGTGVYVGGLIGLGHGTTIDQTFSAGTVTGDGYVGGLVGSSLSQITNSFSTANVNGTNPIGGLVGENYTGGTISNSYSTGMVANGGFETGAFVGGNLGTIQNSYYDITVTGALPGIGVGNASSTLIGATTTQLETQSFIDNSDTTAPLWDFGVIWTTNSDTTTPQLLNLGTQSVPQNGTTDTLNGTAFSDNGGTIADIANETINLIFNGSVVGSTTTSSSGGFTFNISGADLSGGILLTDLSSGGNTYYQANSPAGTINGIDIWGSTVRVSADTASNTALGQTAGSLLALSGIQYAVTAGALSTSIGTNFTILSNYTLDGNITATNAGVISTSANAVLSGSANVTLNGSAVTLAGTFNRTGSLNLTSTNTDITLSGVGTQGTPATAAGMTLNSAGSVIITNSNLAVSGGNFTATGTGDATDTNGIDINGSTINSNGANLSLTGQASINNVQGFFAAGFGVNLVNSTLETAGTGTGTPTTGNITIMGNGSPGSGITTTNTLTGVDAAGSIIRVVNGAIAITGLVTNGTSENSVDGVNLQNATVQATGSGSISVTGNGAGATATAFADGVDVVDSLIEANNASGLSVSGINLNGTASAIAVDTDFTNTVGVSIFSGGVVEATGTAPITIVGVGGDEPSANADSDSGGVLLDATTGLNCAISSTSGAISITGTGGVDANFTSGINVFGPTANTATISSTTGAITLLGSLTTETDLSQFPQAVVIQTGGAVTTQNGAISITGTVAGTVAENNSASQATGVIVRDDGVINATGTGTIFITGTTTGALANTDNWGVQVSGTGTQVSTNGGALTIHGTATDATGTTDTEGLLIENAATVSAANAPISLTGTVSQGVASSGGFVSGIQVLNAGVAATGTGSISAIGDALGSTGSLEDVGIFMQGASITAVNASGLSVSGINLTGTAGALANESVNAGAVGLFIYNGTAISATGTAPITLVGTGGTDTDSTLALNAFSAGLFVSNQVSGMSTSITTTSGALAITGTAGVSPRFDVGMDLYGPSGAVTVGSTSGAVTLDAFTSTSTAPTQTLYGIFTQVGSTVTTQSGLITLDAEIHHGAANLNSSAQVDAVLISGGAINTTGSGSVSIIGNTTGVTGSNQIGAILFVGGNVDSAGGNITMDGIDSTTSTVDDELFGIVIRDATPVTAHDGTISLTGTVSSGTAGMRDFGVRVSEGSTVTGESVSVTGSTVGSIGEGIDTGVVVEGAGSEISATGATALTVTGNSGALTGTTGAILDSGGNGNNIYYNPGTYGVLVSAGGSIVGAGSTPVTLTGTSGTNANTDPTSSSAAITVFSPVMGETTSLSAGGLLSLSGAPLVLGGANNLGAISISSDTGVLLSTPVGTTSTISAPIMSALSLSGGAFVLDLVNNATLGTVSVSSLLIQAGGFDVDLGMTTTPSLVISGAAAITQSAALDTSLLTISAAGSVTLTDAANVISTLGNISSTGPIDIFTDPGMTISGTVTSPSAITIAETGGPLTIASTGSVIETGTANIILAAGTNLANSNYFINNAGANAVEAGSGNFYLFTSDPTYDNFGGITFAPANLIYNAVYPTSANGVVGNAAFFYVAGMGQVGPNSPNNNVPNTTTGGAAGAGSTIVPPVLVTQTSQILPPQPGDGSSGNPSNYLPNGGANSDGTQPSPFSFTGTGVSQLLGQLDGGLANSASNSGQVNSGDIAQLDNGQYSNVSNPQAADVLNEALGPIVYQNLADALKALGDWADVPDKANDTAAGDGETILTGGDVAEMTGTTAKKIPLSQAPEQLRNAMDDNTLKGAGH